MKLSKTSDGITKNGSSNSKVESHEVSSLRLQANSAMYVQRSK